ncbi:MAG: HAD family hydrolase [Acidimicrobiia bacterium]
MIFDCDGVLVDSEWASARAWQEALVRFGIHLDTNTFSGFVGTTDRSLAAAFAADAGVDASEVLDVAEAAMRRVTEGGLRAYSDAIALIGRWEAPVAVASNSDRWRLDLVLRAAGIRDRFGVSVAGDEVAVPKPAPDVYLRSSGLLGVAPVDCMVIEDSPTGIASAIAAGMEVVAVRRGHFPDEALAAANRVVDSLDEL